MTIVKRYQRLGFRFSVSNAQTGLHPDSLVARQKFCPLHNFIVAEVLPSSIACEFVLQVALPLEIYPESFCRTLAAAGYCYQCLPLLLKF